LGLGLGLEMVFVLAAIFGPLISPWNTTEYFLPRQPPSRVHWMGTDYFGHDVFAQLVDGLRLSYLVGALGALCAALVGMALGLSGKRATSIVISDIAPKMASYLFLVVVLLFGSAMLLAASYDFLGLGPTTGISLGGMMNQAFLWSALQLHIWWWFVPPGLVLTGMVAALLIANVGLDEPFNPKLREQ